MAAVLELEHLTKRFGDVVAVDDLTHQAAAGEIVGLIGANGSGKTTTMRMMLGLIHPTSGVARINGVASSDRSARARVGYLPDNAPLEDRWTIGEQLDWWEQLRGPATLRRELEERIDVDRGKRIGELSRGNRQKAAIVMALMHEPDLIVMDEPASGLDPLVRRDLWETLRDTARRGATVLLSSHVLADVESSCDRVVVLRDGRAVFDGAVADLLASATREVRIEFASNVDPRDFGDLPGVESVEGCAGHLSMRLTGSVDPVVKAAAVHEVLDFTTSQPTLERSFAHLNRDER